MIDALIHAPRRALRVFWLALALAGCGGDVDSGGTGSPVFASGTITGFGSVIVGGVHFDDSRASVTDADGSVRSRDDLRLGMTTDVRGSAVGTDATGATISTASSIAFGSAVVGPIASRDLAAARLVVLGQSIDIVATTVFDDVSVGGGLSALALGDVVEVYALLDAASGHYTATRIERKTAVTSFVLSGVVSQFDAATRALSIGTERISYAAFGGILPAALGNGSIVRVRVGATQVAGVWQATTLGDGVQRPLDRDDVRLEGLVSAFVSATQFSVDGVVVDASAVNPAGVALGVRVEVDGTAQGGVLVASKVEVKNAGGGSGNGQDFELRGLVASSDPATLSFVIRGVTIVYSASTEFKDGTAAGLTVGANVDVRGTLSPDGTRVLATRITFR
ncbi:MAG: DUF5666 domain-containing protein [Burkholderiales bacterium]